MALASPLTLMDLRGQPAVTLQLPAGDRAVVLLQGAQLVSWCTGGEGAERLYLSPTALFDGQSAVRGGVPVCFPQFNQRGPMLKHGFARHLPWQLEAGGSAGEVSFSLRQGTLTQLFWPQAFHVRLTISLRPQALRLALHVENTGARPWGFTAALHSYLRVHDVEHVHLGGLEGAQRWDAVSDSRSLQSGAPRFGAEFDSVYQAPATPLALTEAGGGRLRVAQSQSFAQTVVWNPGPELGRRLTDLPDADWRRMLCVEAAVVDTPVQLAPGGAWQGWQHLHWSA